MNFYNIPFLYRLIILFVLFAIVALIEKFKNKQATYKWKEYLFLFICGISGAIFGALTDSITSKISPEYFIYGKNIPYNQDFVVNILKLGAQAGFLGGVCVSFFYLTANNPRKDIAKLPYKKIAKLLSLPVIAAILAAILFGFLSKTVPADYYPKEISAILQDKALKSFFTVWCIHSGIYFGALVTSLFVFLYIRKLRFRLGNYQNKIKFKFKFLSKFYDMFDSVFIFSKTTNPRYGLSNEIPDEQLYVLDACCGTANTSLILAKKNAKNEIIGIDLSQNMIAVANRKTKKQSISNLSFCQMDGSQMAFEDNKFDIGMVSFALHEMGYTLMVKVLKEISRVVKPSGKLYIIDYAKQKNSLKDVLLSVFLKIFEPAHMPQFLRYDWQNILNDIGFDNVKIKKYLFSQLVSANKPSYE